MPAGAPASWRSFLASSVPFLPRPTLAALFLAVAIQSAHAAPRHAELSPWPHDLSPAGLRAAISISRDPESFDAILPEGALIEVQRFIGETRGLGVERRSGILPMPSAAPVNVRANDPTGDRVGETQAEIAVAVYRDTVVIGWNDTKGFLAGNTVSSFAWSTNGGATFTDGGNMPLALGTDQASGDPGVDTDERGNWYYNQIYTRSGPEQDIGVHRGRFNGAGALIWNPPTMASIGTSGTGNLDKCLIACDRVTANVYVAYTRFTANPQIEIVRSTTQGASWGAPIVLDATTTPSTSKQAARPFCGPGGEVYVVWEKGANVINCPDGSGNVTNSAGQIAFSRSLDFGASYSAYSVIGAVQHSWTWSGPGDLRERANEFPDIAVDRSGGLYNGRIYVTWHESAPWSASLASGPLRAEAADGANNNPVGAETFLIGDDVTGSISMSGDLDYWQFSATQGQSLLFNLDPQGFVCGVSGTSMSVHMRLFATQSPYPNPAGFPDSLLAASFLGAFAQRITWTAPRTGTYLVRLSQANTTGTYTLRVRNLTFGAPSPARDARDVVVVSSSNQGASFGAEQRINDDAAGLENRRPFVSVDGLGHAHVFWHDSRDPGFGTNAALTTVYGTTSRDGGATWTPNFPVTDEPSFFSFNTLGVPNLGDYNQSASWGAVTHPAWSDQRLSTGDVRTPNTNTYTAGRGPDAYTTTIVYDFALGCPANAAASAASSVPLNFTITNTGTVPDQYSYAILDPAGWLVGASGGVTARLAPGAGVSIQTKAEVPDDCKPAANTFTLVVTPIGDPDGTKTCTTTLSCTDAPTDVTLVSDTNPAKVGTTIVFTATVSTPNATGSVEFFDGASSLGVRALSSGAASLSTSSLGIGTHPITAVYGGDASHSGGTSNVVQQQVVADQAPTVVVRSPNGGEVTVIGGQMKIEWTAADDNGVTAIDLRVSRDNGGSWQTIALGQFDDGTYDWTVTPPSTNNGNPSPVYSALIKVEAHDGAGNVGSDVSDGPFAIHDHSLSGVVDEPITDFALERVGPNPSAGRVELMYALPRSADVRLSIVDVQGREIAVLATGVHGAGRHRATWESRARRGSAPAGLYFVRYETPSRSIVKRFVLAP